MQKLIETLQQEDATFKDLLNCLEEIKALGDVILLKMDGKRSTGWTTIRISLPSLNQEAIYHEDSDFRETLIKALQEYVSIRRLDQ